jgi:hypothetical protein
MESERETDVTADVLERPSKRFKSNEMESFVFTFDQETVEAAGQYIIETPTIKTFGEEWSLTIDADGNNISIDFDRLEEPDCKIWRVTYSCKDWNGPRIRFSKRVTHREI